MKQTNQRNYVLRVLCSIFLLVAVSVTLLFIQINQHSRVKAAVTMPYVLGNQIIDGYGNQLVLRGSHIQSILDRYKQYATTADRLAYNHLNSATFDEMANNWHMNTVRIATSDYIWQKWPGGPTAYIQALQSIVSQANQAGLYVVLSMHEELSSGLPPSQKEPSGWAMPTPFAVNYWQAIAAAFKNNPMVMFDLYNEPHVNKTALTIVESDWQFWLNGGTITYTTPIGKVKTYTVVGMQTLVNAVRGQGANQIIIAQAGENSFLNFESDCTQLGLDHHCNFLQDPANTTNPNIVYSVHEYFVPISKTPRQSPFWDGKFGILSEEVPIFIGEWEFSINTAYVTRCEDVTGTRSLTADEATALVDSFLSYMDGQDASGQKISWTTLPLRGGKCLPIRNILLTHQPVCILPLPLCVGRMCRWLVTDG